MEPPAFHPYAQNAEMMGHLILCAIQIAFRRVGHPPLCSVVVPRNERSPDSLSVWKPSKKLAKSSAVNIAEYILIFDRSPDIQPASVAGLSIGDVGIVDKVIHNNIDLVLLPWLHDGFPDVYSGHRIIKI